MIHCPYDVQEKLKTLVGTNVSCETFLQLDTYLSLLEKENQKYNLVGPREIERLWERHVLDSAQLFPFLVECEDFLDVGSGAGFPGVVLSLLGARGGCLVEASQKKCAFLENVSRETGSVFSVLNARVESLGGKSFDRIVSRAVAPLESLLGWTKKIYSPKTKYVFLKGKRWEREVEGALKKYSFEVSVSPSVSSPEGKIITIQNVVF